MRAVVGWYAVAVGLLMAGWWALALRGGALDRPDRSRTELGLHLAAEFLTAALLVLGGTVLLVADTAGVVLVALGMLLYTVIQSPGYFLARREREPAVMFAVLVVTTLGAIGVLLAS
jgi:hypothetical protein